MREMKSKTFEGVFNCFKDDMKAFNRGFNKEKNKKASPL